MWGAGIFLTLQTPQVNSLPMLARSPILPTTYKVDQNPQHSNSPSTPWTRRFYPNHKQTGALIVTAIVTFLTGYIFGIYHDQRLPHLARPRQRALQELPTTLSRATRATLTRTTPSWTMPRTGPTARMRTLSKDFASPAQSQDLQRITARSASLCLS